MKEEQLPFGVELEKESGVLTISQTALTNSHFSHLTLFPQFQKYMMLLIPEPFEDSVI